MLKSLIVALALSASACTANADDDDACAMDYMTSAGERTTYTASCQGTCGEQPGKCPGFFPAYGVSAACDALPDGCVVVKLNSGVEGACCP